MAPYETFQGLTPSAIRVLEYANEEARGGRASAVGPEHLLLGLLRDEDSAARQVLEGAGINLLYARSKVRRVARQAGSGVPTQSCDDWSPEARQALLSPGLNRLLEMGAPHWSPGAHRVLEAALKGAGDVNAKRGLPHFVDTEHLLFGLMEESENAAIRVLLVCGADLDQLRKEVLRLFDLRVGFKPKAQ